MQRTKRINNARVTDKYNKTISTKLTHICSPVMWLYWARNKDQFILQRNMPPRSRKTGKGKGRKRVVPWSSSPPPTNDVDTSIETEQELDLEEQISQDTEAETTQEDTPWDWNGSWAKNTREVQYKKTKKKKNCRLRNDQEEAEILEWVEEHPCLWNLKHREYRNKALKNRLWEEKAQELGYEGKKGPNYHSSYSIIFINLTKSKNTIRKNYIKHFVFLLFVFFFVDYAHLWNSLLLPKL